MAACREPCRPLEGTDAATLIARLVELCREDRKAAPQDVTAVVEPAAVERKTERRTPHRDRPTHRERDFDARAARFEINWGHCDGATPQRLLAMLCRRGDVTSRVIGAIDIDGRTATFEVADSAARRFEHSATQPDSRDPNLVIRRARARRR
jgi:ATP-dependent RNA helicase DeaD